MSREHKKHVFYMKGVVYSNVETYEDTEVLKGYMTLKQFVAWCNRNFNQTTMGYRYDVSNVAPMLQNGKLNQRHGGNKLDIRRCHVPGVYHGMIIKVVGTFINTLKRKQRGQNPKGKLYYYTHTNGMEGQ